MNINKPIHWFRYWQYKVPLTDTDDSKASALLHFLKLPWSGNLAKSATAILADAYTEIVKYHPGCPTPNKIVSCIAISERNAIRRALGQFCYHEFGALNYMWKKCKTDPLLGIIDVARDRLSPFRQLHNEYITMQHNVKVFRETGPQVDKKTANFWLKELVEAEYTIIRETVDEFHCIFQYQGYLYAGTVRKFTYLGNCSTAVIFEGMEDRVNWTKNFFLSENFYRLLGSFKYQVQSTFQQDEAALLSDLRNCEESRDRTYYSL